MRRVLALLVFAAIVALGTSTVAAREGVGGGGAPRSSTPDVRDIVQIHQIEIAFHKAGTTKDLNLMLSLFADDATLTAGGKTYIGKEQVRTYWTHAGPFLPQNHWAGYTPAYKIRISVDGDQATLYFGEFSAGMRNAW
jgi:ketosteroid isomerase-like protein